MNERISKGTADKNLYLLAEAFANRVKEFLNRFISFYEVTSKNDERTEKMFFSYARIGGIPEKDARVLYDTVNNLFDARYNKFKSFIQELDAAVARTGEYIATLQPAV